MTTVQVTDTAGFQKLAKDSEGRNRGPTEKLLDQLDPAGVHMLSFQMIHNDQEWRCIWLCKLKDEKLPVHIHMDNSFEAISKYVFPLHIDMSEDADGVFH